MAECSVVTGGDSKYYPLIEDLVESLRGFRSADELNVYVMDAGLTGDQRTRLTERYAATVLDVDWHFQLPANRIRGREHLKVQIARAFLDRYVNQGELLAWIDADAWVQDIAALDMAFDAARTGRLAIVSQTSRYADRTITLRWVGLGYAQIRSILYKNARRAGVKESLARLLADRPTLNSGVFALARNAPHWEAWRKWQKEVLKRGRIFTSDQLSLGLAVYVDGLPVELLPETCNYMGPWTCSNDAALLLERYVPNAPVGIVHMAGYDDMRRSLDVTTDVQTLDGRVLQRSLRRPAWVKSSAP